MNTGVNVAFTFLSINLFHELLTLFLDHPYFIAFQDSLWHVWKVIVHISRKPLMNIDKEDEEKILNSEDRSFPEVDYYFVILGAFCFMCVICWSIWNYRRKHRNILASSKDLSNLSFKSEDHNNLKEVHKILKTLNRQLAYPTSSRIPRLYGLHSARDRRKLKLSSGTQFSNISVRKGVRKKPSNEELRQNLKTALQLLEGVITENKNTPSEISKYEEIGTSVSNFDHNQVFAYENERNESTPTEMEWRNMENWLKHFENDDTALFDDEIDDRRIPLNPKGQKEDNGAPEKYPKSLMSSSASCCEEFPPYRNYSPRGHEKRKFSLKNLHSTPSFVPDSKKNQRKEDLRMVLQLLEKENIDNKFTADDALRYHQEDTSNWNIDEEDTTIDKLENQRNKMNTKSFKLNFGSDHEMKDEKMTRMESYGFIPIASETESSFCNVQKTGDVEYLKKTETLSYHHHKVDFKDNTDRRSAKESKDKTLCIRCSKSCDWEQTNKDLNLNIPRPKTAENKVMPADEILKQTPKSARRKDFLNVSAQRNVLNIAILFNRDIQSAKCL